MIYIIDTAMKQDFRKDGVFLQTVESLTRKFDINNENDVTVLELGPSKDLDDNLYIVEELTKMDKDPLKEKIFLYRDEVLTKGIYNTINMVVDSGIKIDLITSGTLT